MKMTQMSKNSKMDAKKMNLALASSSCQLIK